MMRSTFTPMAHARRGSLLTSRSSLGILIIFSLILCLAVPVVRAWTQDDFEIFDLVDELEKSEGKNVNFYSWLNIPPSASTSDINRAYRKMSLKLHPDKNKEDPKAREKFARLGKIVAILRNSAKRERYDFFYKNGVPRWRGTGYYYSRYRPGLTSVIIFLLCLGGCIQYMVSWINYYQEKRRIAGFVADARAAMTYKVPKSQIAPTLGRSYIEVAGRALRCEVMSDEYIIVYPGDDDTSEPVHLNTAWVQRPSITRNIYLIHWPVQLFKKLFRLGKEKHDKDDAQENDVSSNEDNVTEDKKAKKRKTTKRTETVQGSKVGGRRRAIRK